MAANVLNRLNRVIDHLFGFELQAAELQQLEGDPAPRRSHAAHSRAVVGSTSSQSQPCQASLPRAPHPAAH